MLLLKIVNEGNDISCAMQFIPSVAKYKNIFSLSCLPASVFCDSGKKEMIGRRRKEKD